MIPDETVVEREAEAVFAKYREVHGPVGWDFAEVITVHVSCQVIVELRVST